MKIALAGNPNSGKTTLFNDLTGSSQYVGNWPGVTVEKKEGKLREHEGVTIQDLPGIYSLSPYSMEEVVARQYLVNEQPDAIINIVDGTNIERNLYLTTQLLELDIPMVLAVNMIDLVRKNGDKIDIKKLSKDLGCTVMELSALRSEGSMEVAEKAIEIGKSKPSVKNPHVFTGSVEHALAHIEESIEPTVGKKGLRWYAVKVFERDEKAITEMGLPQSILDHVESHIVDCEEEMDDDAESIITSQRYDFIGTVIADAVSKGRAKGELSASDKIDKIVTNRILALPIFAVVMFIVYWFSITAVGTPCTDWVNDELFGTIIPPAVTSFLQSIGCAQWLIDLIVGGVIGGVGTVLGFLPQILCIFLCLAILEDCGYMSRIAFVMDRIFRRFGLSGKSFIPMLIGSGCGVPAVMATRTIENEKDRRMTILLCTFIPCSAKSEIIGMVSSVFFPGNAFIATAMYLLAWVIIICSGIALKKTSGFAGETAPFVMELPAYHWPQPKTVLLRVWDRAKHFLIKAGTIIFAVSVIVWFLMSYTWSLQYVDSGSIEIEHSILRSIGEFIAPIFAPLGFDNWQGGVSVLVALSAKELAASTISVLAGGMKNVPQMFTAMGAFSYMLLNLFNPPCIAAMSTIMREMGDKKWGWFAIGFQAVLGYCVALVSYQLGNWLFFGASFGFGQIVAIILLVYAIYMIVRPAPKNKSAQETEVKEA